MGEEGDKISKLNWVALVDKSNFSKRCGAVWERGGRGCCCRRLRGPPNLPGPSPPLLPLITFPVLLRLAFPRSWPFR